MSFCCGVLLDDLVPFGWDGFDCLGGWGIENPCAEDLHFIIIIIIIAFFKIFASYICLLRLL